MYRYHQKNNKGWNGKTPKAQNRKSMAESKESWWLKGREGQDMTVWRAGIPRRHPLRRTWHPADAHEAAGAHDFSTVRQEEERHVQWEMRQKDQQREASRVYERSAEKDGRASKWSSKSRYKFMQLIMMNPGSLWVISCFLESRWSWTVHKNALATGIQSIRVNIYLHTPLCECMTREGKCVFL